MCARKLHVTARLLITKLNHVPSIIDLSDFLFIIELFTLSVNIQKFMYNKFKVILHFVNVIIELKF